MKGRASAYSLLVLGICGISTATLWIRYSGDEPGALAFRRLAFAVPILFVWTRLSGARLAVPRHLVGWLIFSGMCLAVHFYLWITSLTLLPVAISVILMSLHPVMVFGVELARGQAPLRPAGIIGIVVAFSGAAWLQRGELSGAGDYGAGVWLALASGAAMAGYLLTGKRVRATVASSTYVFGAYGVAAIGLAIAQAPSLGLGLLPATEREWLIAGLLAVVPTLLGHTPLTAALDRLPATVISVAFLGEPALAPVIVWLAIGETVPSSFYLGGALIAVGIVLVTRAGMPRASS